MRKFLQYRFEIFTIFVEIVGPVQELYNVTFRKGIGGNGGVIISVLNSGLRSLDSIQGRDTAMY